MSKVYRGILCGLAILLLFCGVGIAETEEPILRVSIQADKQEYGINETAKLTITVENTSDIIAADVNIANILPDGLVYAPQQKDETFTHAEIQPHTSVQHELYVRVVDVKLPQTGDQSPDMLILVCLALAGMAALAMISRRTTGMQKRG